MTDEPQPTEIETQLTRLADGSLPAAERSELLEQVRRDPELRARLEAQERGASLVRAVDVGPSDALRGRLGAMLGEPVSEPQPEPEPASAPTPASASASGLSSAEERGGPSGAGQPRGAERPMRRRRSHWRGSSNPRWRRGLFLPGATALAVVVAAIVLIVGYTSPAPTIRQTANVALASATAPAPATAHGHPELLALGVDGIPFPAYAADVGFQASGTRTVTIHHRRIVTVYYRSADGTRVGYSIVPGSSLADDRGRSQTTRAGVRYTFGQLGAGRYVTWVRQGHTCVIAGRAVGDATLLALAIADERTPA